MSFTSRRIIPVILLIFVTFAASGPVLRAETQSENSDHPIIRVNTTRQGYHFSRPWQRRSPTTTTAIGVVIRDNRVLVTAELLADHRYIELENIETGDKAAAEPVVIDYEANLALLKASDPGFLKNMRPMEIVSDTVQGDILDVWQVKPNGDITPSPGPVTAVELRRYFYGNSFLVYRMNHSLQYRFNNYTLPVVKNGKLAGLLMRHDSSGQTTDVVPAPVIEHFLSGAENGEYRGFPRSGVFIGNTEDPQLRKYAGISGMTGGVYVEAVVKGSAAEKAGLLQGDIVMRIAGHDIDNRGNFEHPLYGKVAMPHLVRCEFHAGETVPHRIFRNGKMLDVDIVPERRAPEDWLVPPYRIDSPPDYFILGGLVIQELTVSHLMEYGSDWSAKAPVHLVYYATNQDFIDTGERKKIVFLSSVLPSAYTIGYEDLSNLIISKINDTFISRIEDVPVALKTPVNGFHKIELEQHPRLIFLDAAQIPEIDEQIMKRYRLTQLENLNNK